MVACWTRSEPSRPDDADMTPRKDMEAVIREARQQDWRVERTRGGHWRLYSPDGRGIVHVSGTPRGPRAVVKAVAALRAYGFVWKGR